MQHVISDSWPEPDTTCYFATHRGVTVRECPLTMPLCQDVDFQLSLSTRDTILATCSSALLRFHKLDVSACGALRELRREMLPEVVPLYGRKFSDVAHGDHDD
jgi:hypothetical protein